MRRTKQADQLMKRMQRRANDEATSAVAIYTVGNLVRDDFDPLLRQQSDPEREAECQHRLAPPAGQLIRCVEILIDDDVPDGLAAELRRNLSDQREERGIIRLRERVFGKGWRAREKQPAQAATDGAGEEKADV
jgi:hypothetical protein